MVQDATRARITLIRRMTETAHTHHGETCHDKGCMQGYSEDEFLVTGLRKCFVCACTHTHGHRDDCPRKVTPGHRICYNCQEVQDTAAPDYHVAQNCPKEKAQCGEKLADPKRKCNGEHHTYKCPVTVANRQANLDQSTGDNYNRGDYSGHRKGGPDGKPSGQNPEGGGGADRMRQRRG